MLLCAKNSMFELVYPLLCTWYDRKLWYDRWSDKFAIKKFYDTSETYISGLMTAYTGGIEHVIDLNYGDS